MKKLLFTLLGLLLLLGVVFTWQYSHYQDGKLHIVFCDVGQGDGIYIRTPQHSNILIDSGPDTKILDCLSRHMPFWDRHFSFVILTHPHADHLNGFVPVIEDYDVDMFVTEPLANNTAGYKKLLSTLESHHIPVKRFIAGDVIKSSSISFTFVGPLSQFLTDTSPHGLIGETGEFGSLETLITYGKTTALFTGDSQYQELEEALPYLHAVDLLQVPHHGSKYGLSEKVISALRPGLAVISVGAGNRYGHPHEVTLDELKKFGIPVKRTDKSGDIEIVSDGRKMSLL